MIREADVANASILQRIVDAAMQVIIDSGNARLTLDEVAAKAGVSKGGLLYHFPKKRFLLKYLMNIHVERVEENARIARTDLAGVNKTLRSQILAQSDMFVEAHNMASVLLTNAYDDPNRLAPLKAKLKGQLGSVILEAGDDILAAVIFLALRIEDIDAPS